ncbi:MAG: type II secretion system F family protein [Planctomycetota bacterium]
MDPLMISGVAFLAVTALVVAVAYLVRDMKPTRAEDRLQILTGTKPGADGQSAPQGTLMRDSMSSFSESVSSFFGRLGSLPLLLEQADSPVKADMFYAMTGGLACVGLVVAIVVQSPPPLYPIAAILTGVLPLMWILWRRKRRFDAFGKQLPDALELIARALRSGHSLSSGMHVVIDEMPAPISTEFGMAYEQQNLGQSIDQALKSMLKRVPNLDLKFFVTAVVIQRQAGGDLAEILDKIGHIIRERFKILGAVQALTGEGRISGIVLMVMPIAIFIAVYQLNPDYMMTLFRDPLGRNMLAIAAGLQVLGAVVIKKIIAIKV